MGQVSNLAASREIPSSWRVTAMGAGKKFSCIKRNPVLLEGYCNGAGK